MKILLVAATVGEISPLLKAFPWTSAKDFKGHSLQRGGSTFDLIVTGVGGVATTFAMSQLRHLSSYTAAINLGVAGSFTDELPLGSVCKVNEDQFADLGAEDGDEFIDVFSMGLMDPNATPFKSGRLYSSPILDARFDQLFSALPAVKGITVNKVHGNDRSIAALVNRLKPEVESMEGAAFFYTCGKVGLPCMQIRSISNRVEKRNRANWKLEEAISKLNSFATELISSS